MPHSARHRAARRAGVWLLLTAAATAIMVVARVSSDTDQATIAESLRSVVENRELFGLTALARLASGVTLLVAGWYMLKAGASHGHGANAAAAYLFMVSGGLTVVSGAAATVIALHPSLDAGVEAPAVAEAAYHVRWVMGKAGFSVAGIALVFAAFAQWSSGSIVRYVAPISAVLGFAMQFIWWDAATVVHRAVGMLFLAWVVVVGAALIRGALDARASNDGDAAAASG